MPSGGNGRGRAPSAFSKRTIDSLDIVSDYRGLIQERKLKGLPRPHRPIVVSVLAEYYETTPRMIRAGALWKISQNQNRKAF